MAWLRVDQSLRDHRKVLIFASELGCSQAAATGHLVLLWLWCLDNAPTGILKGINGQQIATAAAWRRNPNSLVNALLSAGFLEKCGRGGSSLRIHDWYEYTGKLIEARAAHRDRTRRSRAALRNDTEENERVEESKKTSPPFGGGRPKKKTPFDRYKHLIRRTADDEPLSGKHRGKVAH